MSKRNIEGNKMYEELLEELDACKSFARQALNKLEESDLKNDKELRRMMLEIEEYAESSYDWVKDEALG